jgi:molybdopterin molybdotransferase
MISIPEALATVLGAVRLRPAEQVGLSDSLGRVLAADVMVPFDVPPFANSQMDGFAVRTADLAEASAAAPRRLRVRGALARLHDGGASRVVRLSGS